MSVGRDYRFREVLNAAGMNEELVIAVCTTNAERADDAETSVMARWWVEQLDHAVQILAQPIERFGAGQFDKEKLAAHRITVVADLLRYDEPGMCRVALECNRPLPWLNPIAEDDARRAVRPVLEFRKYFDTECRHIDFIRFKGMRHTEEALIAILMTPETR
jgi:hypothetical protein